MAAALLGVETAALAVCPLMHTVLISAVLHRAEKAVTLNMRSPHRVRTEAVCQGQHPSLKTVIESAIARPWMIELASVHNL